MHADKIKNIFRCINIFTYAIKMQIDFLNEMHFKTKASYLQILINDMYIYKLNPKICNICVNYSCKDFHERVFNQL